MEDREIIRLLFERSEGAISALSQMKRFCAN